MEKELLAQLVALEPNVDIGLHLKTIRGISVDGISNAELGRIAGVLEAPGAVVKKGLVSFIVAAKSPAFPNLAGRLVYLPLDEIIAVDVPV
jgi:hypothetical protein